MMLTLVFLVLVGAATFECKVFNPLDQHQDVKRCQERINSTQDGHNPLQQVACKAKCKLEAFGLINEDGSMSIDKVRLFFNSSLVPIDVDLAVDVWKNCLKNETKGSDQCEHSFRLANCLSIGLESMVLQQTRNLYQQINLCKAQTNDSDAMIKSLFAPGAEPLSSEIGCLLRCGFEKTGAMLTDWSIDYKRSRIVAALLVSGPVDDFMELVRICENRNESKADLCAYSYKLAACVKEQTLKKYIAPPGNRLS